MIDELLKIGFETRNKKALKSINSLIKSIKENKLDEKIINSFNFSISQCNINIDLKRKIKEKSYILLYELIGKWDF